MKINVSIIIPTFNRDIFLERSIRSALATQSVYHSSEIIVVDDGSTDSTPYILEKFALSLSAGRWHYSLCEFLTVVHF